MFIWWGQDSSLHWRIQHLQVLPCIRVWRRRWKLNPDATVIEYDRYGGGSITAWCGWEWSTVNVNGVQGKLTDVSYQNNILQALELPELQEIRQSVIFQEDNAEHLWNVLGCRLRANHSSAVDSDLLYQFLGQEWQAISKVTCRTLVASIQASARHTHFNC